MGIRNKVCNDWKTSFIVLASGADPVKNILSMKLPVFIKIKLGLEAGSMVFFKGSGSSGLDLGSDSKFFFTTLQEWLPQPSQML